MSFFSRFLGGTGHEPVGAPHPLRTQLIRDEGRVLHAYRDSRGFLTIGVGHNLDADPSLRERLLATAGDEAAIVIDEATADRLLENDIAVAEDDVKHHIACAADLDDCRRGVLVNMSFNLGIGGLLAFHKMLAALARKDYLAAAAEMRNSKWYGQVGARALRLSRQMESGEWV